MSALLDHQIKNGPNFTMLTVRFKSNPSSSAVVGSRASASAFGIED